MEIGMKRIFSSITVKRSAMLLITLCLLMGLITTLIGGYVAKRTTHLSAEWGEFEQITAKKSDALMGLQNAMGYGGMIHQFKNYILRGDEPRVEKFSLHVDTALGAIKIYRDLGVETMESTALKEIETTIENYSSKILLVTKMISEGLTVAQIDGRIKVSDAQALQALQDLERHVTSMRVVSIEDFHTDLDEITGLVFLAAYGFPLFLAVLACLLWYGLRSLLKQLGAEPVDVIDVSRQVADGELVLTECQMEKDASSAMGALVATVGKLVEVITEIRASADSVDESARVINDQNRELSQRTLSQAANLEQTSSSMEEMTETVKKNAENAFTANTLTLSASKRAEQGGEVDAEAITAMTEIHASNQKIGDITGVIDDIAFQTNLLALNAAVEAAHAGEHGRGFAVVASEVRNLAQRSAEAAKEIKVLIEDSAAKVESGSSRVNEAGETLNELIESVRKVSDLMAEMATANEEQTQGIEQVNQAMIQMESETQQNTELVEKASQASASMTQQAHALRKGVDFFKLGKHLEAVRKTPALDPYPQQTPAIENSSPQVPMDSGSWGGEERRSVVRPWSGDTSPAPVLKSAPIGKPSSDQQNDWDSF
jgi:methyl-accepting chemotaxis protein